jgi:hypothetical protein
MSQTFNFEELDQATHDYLVAVRDAEGGGTPGVFVPSSDSLPGCGCIVGPIVIGTTLALTLTDWVDVIQNEPRGVALLQTAGLLLGGWLLAAGFRGSKGSDKVAGCWAYADPLYLYEAFREQVTVTAIDDVVEAQFTHNYNNGSYQNSVVTIRLSGTGVKTLTVSGEAPAERMVVYLNYLAWARGGEGGDRANLPPATLGGLAKFVAKNDREPLDNENNINLSEIDLDVTEVPEEPIRDRTAAPSFLPYVVMLVAAAVCWCLFAFVVNPPLRDDVVYNILSKPAMPLSLRKYLLDERNTKHRTAALQRLEGFYSRAITECRNQKQNPALGEGMAKTFEALSTAVSPVVTLRVTERAAPDALKEGRGARENDLRTQFADGISQTLASLDGYGVPKPEVDGPIDPLNPPRWEPAPPPPIGHQLADFLEPPEDAKGVHIDISYTIEQTGAQYTIKAVVEIRLKVDEDPIARGTVGAPGAFTGADLAFRGMTALRDQLILALLGRTTGNGAGVVPQFPQIPKFPQ